MFNGIIETIGKVIALEKENGCKHFTLAPEIHFDDIKIGDSIAVNGVCMTVTRINHATFDVTAVPETLRLTNLDQLKIGHSVNLERSLQANSRISGHQVQGHIDGMGRILELKNDDSNALLASISLPNHLSKYVVNKGYITLDGMSITVIESTSNQIRVTFIPHTQQVTIIQQYKVGDVVNIEVDILGKYIEKLIGVYAHDHTH